MLRVSAPCFCQTIMGRMPHRNPISRRLLVQEMTKRTQGLRVRCAPDRSLEFRKQAWSREPAQAVLRNYETNPRCPSPLRPGSNLWNLGNRHCRERPLNSREKLRNEPKAVRALMSRRSAPDITRRRGMMRIDGTKIAAVHLLADHQRPVREFERPGPSDTVRWRINPVLLGNHRMAAEDLASASALRFARPARPARHRWSVLKQRANQSNLAPHVDPEMIDERLSLRRLGKLIF